MIAALYIDSRGPYADVPGLDLWPIERDARNYDGPYPVIAHPPCERWGRYWFGGPSVKVRFNLGQDNNCFEGALYSVRTYGGVIEHPAHSKAWDVFDLPKPEKTGWTGSEEIGFSCEVCQGHYGHKAEKRTWLYVFGVKQSDLPELIWGRAPGRMRLDEGFHSKEERRIARLNGKAPIKRLSKKDNIHTPKEFMNILINIASKARVA